MPNMLVTHLGFLEASIHTRFEIAEITEDTFLKFLHVADGPPKCLFGDGSIFILRLKTD